MAHETEVPPGFYPWGHDEKPNKEPSEYSWGPELTPPHACHAAPDDGGLYGGKSPGTAPGYAGQRHGVPGRQARA